MIKIYGIKPTNGLLDIGELPRITLEPILQAESRLPIQKVTYLLGDARRRQRLLPAALLTNLFSEDAFIDLINSVALLEDVLKYDVRREVLGVLQYYSPNDPPLPPHVDSGDFTLVVGIRFTGLHPEKEDESLRWFDFGALGWRTAPMRVGTLVMIDGGVLHAVRRTMLANRTTLIITFGTRSKVI